VLTKQKNNKMVQIQNFCCCLFVYIIYCMIVKSDALDVEPSISYDVDSTESK